MADFCGVSIETVKNWAKQGMPGTPNAYDVSEIIQWLRSVGPWRQHAKPDSDDPLLSADGDSPGLERYRQAKAALAELELEERKGTLLSRDKARSTLGRWASIVRRLGERLGRRYGPEATTAVNDAILECQHVIDHEFGTSDASDQHAA